MGVPGDRVGALDPGQRRAQPRREGRRAAPGRVHVQPGALAARDLGDGGERVDHPGGGRPRGRHHRQRLEALRSTLRHRARQRRRVERQPTVDGHETQGAGAESGEARDFDERVVRLLAGVDGEPGGVRRDPSLRPGRTAMRQRRQDCGQVRLGAAAREGHGGLGRHADEGRQRPQRVALHLDGAGGVRVGGELRVVGRHERVGGHRHLAHAGVEEAQVARVGHLHAAALEQSRRGVEGLVRRHGPREVERALDLGAHLGRLRFAAHGLPRQAAREVVDSAVEGAPEGGRIRLAHRRTIRAAPRLSRAEGPTRAP